MQDKDALDPRPADGSEWTDAWEAVTRLAAARHSTVHEPGQDRLRVAPEEGPADRRQSDLEAGKVAPVDPGQLARAVAEIEKASAALRRSEPALEIWRPGSAPRREARKHLSVWLLIGGIWISATLMVAGATGAILYLLG